MNVCKVSCIVTAAAPDVTVYKYTVDYTGLRRDSLISAFLHVSLYCFLSVIVIDSMNAAAPVAELRFVCRACQERNMQAIFSSKRALHNHMTKSKNPRCRSAGSDKIRVITRPGDVVAGGTGGMGPCPEHCPPPQHQPPGI